MRIGRGFTLIELVVSVSIVGLLASVVLPLSELVVQRNKEYELRLALREIRGALDAYKLAVEEGRVVHSTDKSGYPASLRVLVEGEPDAANPEANRKIYFLRRVPRDPFETDTELAAEETWGKRSYASSADSPLEGEDVFDVYSRAAGVGLNGVPYREW
ncbi:MAG: type II secretion system protein [Sideroxyarcus sp.]|nr:type II secretion system protein [Sideroxyarcus sp.]